MRKVSRRSVLAAAPAAALAALTLGEVASKESPVTPAGHGREQSEAGLPFAGQPERVDPPLYGSALPRHEFVFQMIVAEHIRLTRPRFWSAYWDDLMGFGRDGRVGGAFPVGDPHRFATSSQHPDGRAHTLTFGFYVDDDEDEAATVAGDLSQAIYDAYARAGIVLPGAPRFVRANEGEQFDRPQFVVTRNAEVKVAYSVGAMAYPRVTDIGFTTVEEDQIASNLRHLANGLAQQYDKHMTQVALGAV